MARARPVMCAWLLEVILAGCTPSPEPPSDTGSKDCVRGFYEALIQKDWPRAYAALDRQDQKRCSPQQFSQLAQSYRAGLSFEPQAVVIQVCEERGATATAHVVLTGRANEKEIRYRDGVTMRRGDDGWSVVLPSGFGRAKK